MLLLTLITNDIPLSFTKIAGQNRNKGGGGGGGGVAGGGKGVQIFYLPATENTGHIHWPQRGGWYQQLQLDTMAARGGGGRGVYR